MPKEEWGVKRVCPTTGKRFYDLNRDPIVSPYTGEVVEIVSGKSRAMTPDAEDAATKKLKTTEKDSESGEMAADDATEVAIDDDLLEDDDEDTVSFDDIADVESDDEL